jgi:asparagine synthase (glutamine-hydrolysing)
MGGIVGYWRCADRKPIGDDIEEMVSQIEHRGPDGRGDFSFDQSALGQLRLESGKSRERAAEPYCKDSLAAVADARLDNRDELCRRLGVPSSGGVTDVELIARAYQEWGVGCPDELLGAFAFAVFDRANERLFCARDHMGVKPLYWWHDDGLVVFGSEIKAILAHRSVPNELFEPRLGTYLAGTYHDIEWTFFEGVARLPAGNRLVVDENGARTSSYWDLDSHRELQLGSDQAYADRFRELFIDAVERRTRDVNPVGSTLSGGLDSSAVACTADHLNETGKPIHTFSQVFDEVSECDEREYIETVLDHGHFESHYLPGDRDGPLTHIDELATAVDAPVFAANLFLHRNIYRAVADEGIAVLLDGFDGDTTVSHGYTYLTELARSGSFLRLYQQTRAAATIHHFEDRSVRELLWRYVAAPLAPDPLREVWRKLRGRDDPVKRESPVIDVSFVEGTGVADLLSGETKPFDPPNTVRQAHYNQLRRPLLQVTLEISDKVAAMHGVEPRYPFFDKRLVEFCLSLPPTQKFGGNQTRVVMRRGLEGIYPDPIANRTDKTSLAPNFERGLFERDRDLLERLCENVPVELEAAVDEETLNETLERVRNGEPESGDAIALWRIGTLSHWGQQRERTNPESVNRVSL